MKVLPPGTILQLMYLRERLKRMSPGRFIEIGPGSGEITHLLLSLGWSGVSYDLEEETVRALMARFDPEITEKRYLPINTDFLTLPDSPESVNLVISCMVMEHFEENAQIDFLKQSAARLVSDGLMIGLVPASPLNWGIEDDIAGHCRRYTRENLSALATANGWDLRHIAGLTFPVSNMLLPISNFLVSRSEKSKLKLSALERTRLSGRRKVKFKTHFPPFLGLLLNEITMLPFHFIQKLFKKSESALVLYFELQPRLEAKN